MKSKKILSICFAAAFVSTLSSCASVNRSMREPNVRVELDRDDFTLSDQVSAKASSTTILGIDLARLFLTKEAHVQNSGLGSFTIPVVGNLLSDRTANYALFKLMEENEGYDVVFYPQYETKVVCPVLGICPLTKNTTVNATARLGKLNK